MDLTYPDGEVVHHDYNAQGLLESLSGSSTYVQSTGYDALGRVELRTLGNGRRTDYVYYPWATANGLGRLRYVKTGTASSPTALQYLYYTYDAVGNVTRIKDYRMPGGTQTQIFSYDALDRLIRGRTSGGVQGVYDRTYRYDSIGNLTRKGGTSYGYQDGGHTHAVTHLNGVRKYWYDANGNQTKRITGGGTYYLTYDAENRLTRVKRYGSVVATFVYDGDGNRVKKVEGDAVTVYVGEHYEVFYPAGSGGMARGEGGSVTGVPIPPPPPDDPTPPPGPTPTLPPLPTPTPTPPPEPVVRKYYYAGGQRVAMREGGTLYYLFTDHLGSTALTLRGSTRVGELRYHPYGGTRYSWGSTPTGYRFTGQREDATIGLYFYNARYYDPALGRFISADTVVPEPENH